MSGFIYILQFRENDKYYIGSTDNLKRRLSQHKQGNVPSTRNLGDFQLVFEQRVPNIKIARSAEKRIKSWKRRDFIEKIIQEGKVLFLEK